MDVVGFLKEYGPTIGTLIAMGVFFWKLGRAQADNVTAHKQIGENIKDLGGRIGTLDADVKILIRDVGEFRGELRAYRNERNKERKGE